MKLNERHYIVREAQLEFSKFWVGFMEKHDLTMSEFLNILTSEVQSTINICIRTERASNGLPEHERRRQADGD